MRILMLTDYFLPHLLGGTEKAVYEISKQLVRMGQDVTVVTLTTGKMESRSRVDGIDIYRLPGFSITELLGAQLTLSPFAVFRVKRIVDSIHPDIIHAYNLYFQLTMIAPIIRRLSHSALITTLEVAEMFYERLLLRFLIRGYQKTIGALIIRSSDQLIAVSQSVMKHAIEDLRVPPWKIVMIPNGVDTSVYSPGVGKSEKPIVTYIGRLIENKGPQYLVEAAPAIFKNQPEAQLYIIGDGPLKDQLKRRVSDQRLEDRVHFFGSISDVLPFLQATTVFVRPSLTEGMSLAILQAMACGLPIVATNIEGNAEIVKNGETGFLVPKADSKALGEAIQFLLNNRKIANAMGMKARETVSERYDWKQTAEQTLERYLSLT